MRAECFFFTTAAFGVFSLAMYVYQVEIPRKLDLNKLRRSLKRHQTNKQILNTQLQSQQTGLAEDKIKLTLESRGKSEDTSSWQNVESKKDKSNGYNHNIKQRYGIYSTKPDKSKLQNRKISDQNEENKVKNEAVGTSISPTRSDLDTLTNILVQKLESAEIKEFKFKPTCETESKVANSCGKKCLRTELPDNPKERISQLTDSSKLQLTAEQHQMLRQLSSEIKGTYDIILLTAASSNYYLESQALLKNLHEHVYPYLSNFKLVYFDLGLSQQEREKLQKYCRCQVLTFPFNKFPVHMRNLKCYAWKPVLIKAVIQKSNLVIWVDASVRFFNHSKNLKTLINKTRERGLQIGHSGSNSPFRTVKPMYHFFGDEPCAYFSLGQAKAAFGLYNKEAFVLRAILEPWVACALNRLCIWPPSSEMNCTASTLMAARLENGSEPIVYGMCHRFDQSAISLIVHKLYQSSYKWIMINHDDFLAIQKEDKLVYFPN